MRLLFSSVSNFLSSIFFLEAIDDQNGPVGFNTKEKILGFISLKISK